MKSKWTNKCSKTQNTVDLTSYHSLNSGHNVLIPYEVPNSLYQDKVFEHTWLTRDYSVQVVARWMIAAHLEKNNSYNHFL